MAWRTAPSLIAYRDQLNARAPKRSKKSDGFIGDAAHATRDSDHNPWYINRGIPTVTAGDFTHDPTNGADGNVETARLVNGNDPRIKYIIWQRRIYTPGLGWRPYYGSNPHDKHWHLSHDANDSVNDTSPWRLGDAPVAPQPTAPSGALADGVLKKGDKGDKVSELQGKLAKGYPAYRNESPVNKGRVLSVDGDFGDWTDAWVRLFQRKSGITVDGIVGPQTARMLGFKL
jgi:hypothetical protein